MKIALIGAPGSGKTKLAKRLTQRLNSESDPWKVIDGYVERLEKRVGHPFGPIFDRTAYRCNLQVMAERWTLEDEARTKGYSTITCGTIFETIVYAAAQSIPIPRLPEDFMLVETYIAENMMASFGVLATLTYDYDALFYLPLTGESEHAWPGVVDLKLPEVLAGQYKQAIRLDDNLLQHRTTEATSAIKTLQEAREDLQSRGRRDRETGQEQAHESEGVSDVRSTGDRGDAGDVDVARASDLPPER